MTNKIQSSFSKFSLFFRDLQTKLTNLENNRNVVNYVLSVSILIILTFGVMLYNIDYQRINRYVDIQKSLNKLHNISKDYDFFLTNSQISLKVDQKHLQEISNSLITEQKKLSHAVLDIDNAEYKQSLSELIKVLDKRFTVKDELVQKYNELYSVYKDYLKISLNAEDILQNNMDLQVKIKHIMLSIENIRILPKGNNRNELLQSVRNLRGKLLEHSPEIQSKIGLFTQRAENIILLLRYIDTIKFSMKSDNFIIDIDTLKEETKSLSQKENIKFSLQLWIIFILGLMLIMIKTIIMLWFFYSRKKTDRIKAHSQEIVKKSKLEVLRSKQYVLEAQRGQYKLLKTFCDDFHLIINNVFQLTKSLNDEITSQEGSLEGNNNIAFTIHAKMLSNSVEALENWLSNYLDIHIAREEWRTPEKNTAEIHSILDKIFVQSRFFAGEKEHEMAIFNENSPVQIESDIEYIRHIFMNMVYISLKWSDVSWLKTSTRIYTAEKKPDNTEETEEVLPTHILEFSLIDSSPSETYDLREALFNRTDQDNSDCTEADRFIATSLYYMRQIADLLEAQIVMERDLDGNNILKAQIPVTKIEAETKEDIGVPILQNKTAIIISPHDNILQTIEDQVKLYGMNTTPLNDHYAAIGHIVGAKQSGTEFDIIIVDHHPPAIDAMILAKVVRGNTKAGLVHIIALTSEALLPEIKEKSQDIDEVITKPVRPSELHETLERCIEIQLYGKGDDDDDFFDEDEDAIVKRFLSVMDEDLSSHLIKLIVTTESYHIDIATSNQQATELMESNIYDFMIVSSKGSWTSPEDFARTLRRHHTDNKNAIMILVHNEIADAYQEKLAQSGFDEFIPLPLSKKDFLGRIEKWEKPEERRAEILLEKQQDEQASTDETSSEASKASQNGNDQSNTG